MAIKGGGRKHAHPFKVTLLGPKQVVDLSPAFNETDARELIDKAIADALKRPWLKNSKTPWIVIYPLRNRTSMHISTRPMMLRFAQGLLRSGKVRLMSRTQPRRFFGGGILVNGWLMSKSSMLYKTHRIVRYVFSLHASDVASGQRRWMFVSSVKKKIVIAPSQGASSKVLMSSSQGQ